MNGRMSTNLVGFGAGTSRRPSDTCFISYWDTVNGEQSLHEAWFSDPRLADWLISANKGSAHRMIRVDVESWDPSRGEIEPPRSPVTREQNPEYYARITQLSVGRHADLTGSWF